MTELYLNGHLCDLPTDFKITLVTENLYFSKASTYTYDVKLPMAAFGNNVKILGALNRFDKSVDNLSFTARLLVDGRPILDGIAIIDNVTNDSVSVQLLQGNSKLNWQNKYDKVYIDELDLGTITQWGLTWQTDHSIINENEVTPSVINDPYDHLPQYYYWTSRNFSDYNNGNVVLTPILNTDTGVIMNPLTPTTEFTDKLAFGLHDPTVTPHYEGTSRPYYMRANNLAPQPKLKLMVDKVFEAAGIPIVTNELDSVTFYQKIFIANSSDVNNIADILPHWTIVEFINQLQLMFNVVIDVIDNQTYIYLRKSVYDTQADMVYLENVLDDLQKEFDDTAEVSDADKTKQYDCTYPDYKTEFLGDDFKNVPIVGADKLTGTANPYVFSRNALGLKLSSPLISNNTVIGSVIDWWENSKDDGEVVTLRLVPIFPEEAETVENHHYFITDSGHVYADIVLNYPQSYGHDIYGGGENIQELLDELETPAEKPTIEKLNLGFWTVHLAFRSGTSPNTASAITTYDVLTSKYQDKIYNPISPSSWLIDSEQPYDLALRARKHNDMSEVKNLYSVFYKGVAEIEISNTTSVNFVFGKMIKNVLKTFLIKNQLFACKQIKYTITARGFEKIAEGEFYKL